MPADLKARLGAAIDTGDRERFPDLDDVRVPVNITAGWRGAMMRAPDVTEEDLVFYA